MCVDDLRRIAEATAKLGPSSVTPPDEVRQALFDAVARERAVSERRDRMARNWAVLALAASVALVVAVGMQRQAPPAASPGQSANSWQILQSGVAGVHQRLLGGDSETAARLRALKPGADGWLGAAMQQAGMEGVSPPEFSLARAGWAAQAAVPLTGGGLAIHMRRGEAAITAAMIPAGPAAVPPGGQRAEVHGQTLRSFERDGLAWVFWHEGSVLCVVTARRPAAELVQVVSAGFQPT